MKVIEKSVESFGGSYQGHVVATFEQLCQTFGWPVLLINDAEEKVTTEFGAEVEIDGERVVFTAYDWKEGDGGRKCRNGQPYRWHVGGKSRLAADAAQAMLDGVAS